MSKFTAFLIGVVIALLFASFMGGVSLGIFKLCAVETLTVKQIALMIGVYWFFEVLTDSSKKVL